MSKRSDIRLSLPSKGRLAEDTARFLSACGLAIDKPNPRHTPPMSSLYPD